MRKRFSNLTRTVLLLAILVGCQQVAITGRDQLVLIPSSQLNALSFSEYSNLLNEYEIERNTPDAREVTAVGTDIKNAVERYFRQEGMSEQLDDYAWEVNLLVDDDMVNAFAMPGGKVAVFTGMMDVAETPAQLATVMGHEVAHAIAHHGNERMTQQLLTSLGGVGLAIALRDKPQETQALALAAFGVGTQLGILLPYSRTHESEADHLGLIFMAMAGYDPHEAVDFWENMDQLGGAGPPEWLSTHPAHQTRIENLNEWMPEAMRYYQ
ncbi:TPR repeat-containing protein YfgC precursor [bacterium BMS3Bbin04]|nr:TPR repeat-containing protein YfgC precursor [bacterium BMS3Bbin04]